MRRNSRSLIIYLIFGILIAVFVISFGPQSGRNQSCMPSSGGWAVKVNDHEVSEQSWRFAILALGYGSASGGRARAMRARETVMDRLIERELLAQAAEGAGFRVSDEEVEEKVRRGEMLVVGIPWPGQSYYFAKEEGEDEPRFSYKRLESYARSLGFSSVEGFVGEQKREMVAQKMRDLLAESVRVSPEEAQARYEQEHTKAEIDYVKLEWADYKNAITLAPADVDAYVAAHEAELKTKYDLNANSYKGRGKELRLRHVFIKKVEPAADAPKPPEGAPPPERARADEALMKIKSGKSIAEVAAEMSQDERSAKRGGDLGWRPQAALGWGPEFAKAVEKLEAGKPPAEVIETPRGWHVVQVDGVREGDLSYDQVKRELAEAALLDEKAKAAAREGADKALAQVQGGGDLLEAYPKDDSDETPEAKSSGPITRTTKFLSGASGYIGNSEELAKAIFGQIPVGQAGAKVYEVEPRRVRQGETRADGQPRRAEGVPRRRRLGQEALRGGQGGHRREHAVRRVRRRGREDRPARRLDVRALHDLDAVDRRQTV
jgi:peptidyl-prolyl cis-trans isomerase D